MKSLFVKYDEAPWLEPVPGFKFKPIVIDQLGASVVELTKGVVTTPHEHDDEQVDILLKGKLNITVKDERGERVESVNAGMAFALEPHVLHGVEALEDSLIIEAWAPAERFRAVAITVDEAK